MIDDTLLHDLEQLAELEVESPPWRALEARILRATEPMMAIIARRSSRQPGLDWQRDRDEIVQTVREVHLRMLHEVGAHRFALPLEGWEAALLTRSRSEVRRLAESGGMTGIGAYEGAMRRKRALYELREQLEMDHRALVSDEELVEEHNRAHEARAAGMAAEGKRLHSSPAQVDDLRSGLVHGLDMDLVGVDDLVEEVLGTLSAAELVERTIALAAVRDERLGAVAEVWLSSWSGTGQLPSAAAVARELGLSASTVRSHLALARAIARGLVVVGGTAADTTSAAVVHAIADAWLEDERLARIAELRWSRWAEGGQVVSTEQIAERLVRSTAEVDAAVAELESMVDHYLEVDDRPSSRSA